MFRRNEKDLGAGSTPPQDLPIAVDAVPVPVAVAVPIPPLFLIPDGTMSLSNVNVPNCKG